LAIFLSVALGYLLGKFKIGRFVLGGIAGTLIVGVAIGQLGVDVADSSAVALNHTAGLSTPQQVMMALFALWGLVDYANGYAYKTAAQTIVRQRFETLFKALDLPPPKDAFSADYYVTIDIPRLAANRHGQAFCDWLVNEHEPIDFVWRLANEKEVVLMDGGGFDSPEMSVRVSLANLPDAAYGRIGRAIGELLTDYFETWRRQAS